MLFQLAQGLIVAFLQDTKCGSFFVGDLPALAALGVEFVLGLLSCRPGVIEPGAKRVDFRLERVDLAIAHLNQKVPFLEVILQTADVGAQTEFEFFEGAVPRVAFLVKFRARCFEQGFRLLFCVPRFGQLSMQGSELTFMAFEQLLPFAALILEASNGFLEALFDVTVSLIARFEDCFFVLQLGLQQLFGALARRVQLFDLGAEFARLAVGDQQLRIAATEKIVLGLQLAFPQPGFCGQLLAQLSGFGILGLQRFSGPHQLGPQH